jgi:hypothetical protein
VGTNSNSRRGNFFARHSKCCFCGGGRVAEEIDHVPSRAIFRDRQWPEEYEFPACAKCNRATRHDEQIVAMLSRIYSNGGSPEDDLDFAEKFRAVAHNYPDVIREMQPMKSQLRDAGRRYGIRPVSGQLLSDLPLLSVRGPLVNQAVDNFSRKLACALFYKNAGRIVPPHAPIAVRWYANLQIENEEIPRELAPLLGAIPTLVRAKTSLEDQFFYRWVASDTSSMAAFLSFFRKSFAVLTFINASDLLPGPIDKAKIVYPYKWD